MAFLKSSCKWFKSLHDDITRIVYSSWSVVSWQKVEGGTEVPSLKDEDRANYSLPA